MSFAAACATLCYNITVLWRSNWRSIGVKLDRIDIRILHELQKNGRITNVELAELVH